LTSVTCRAYWSSTTDAASTERRSNGDVGVLRRCVDDEYTAELVIALGAEIAVGSTVGYSAVDS